MNPLKDRETAGRLLSEVLSKKSWKNTLILALPRGGVPVAWEISKQLNLPWDVLLVKKIGAPEQPEFAIGAVSEDKMPIWNKSSIESLNLPEIKLLNLADKTRKKIIQQTKKWRKQKPALDVKNKNVIVVDDGLATGLTMHAAVEFLQRRGAKSITVAAPVGSKSAVDSLTNNVENIFVLSTPEPFFSVGQWYEDFTQVTDDVVTKLLEQSTHSGLNQLVNGVEIPFKGGSLMGELVVPENTKGIIVFAHGSGSSHKSPRNKQVAKALNQIGFSTLLFDLLTLKESKIRANVFNISLLSERLNLATEWVRKHNNLKSLPVAYFGSSTGAAAALVCASKDKQISTVVSRGGRTDMANDALKKVKCPVLLIVGGNDHQVLQLNKNSQASLSHAKLVQIPGAGHIFEEPGALDKVIEYACDWFLNSLDKDYVNYSVEPHEVVINEIINSARSFENQEQLDQLLQNLSQSRVVMFGESTHGTEEFYEIRRELSQQLIEKHNFKFIAVEGDWPDCYKLNKYIQLREDKSVKEIMSEFKRWPTWMWANEQTAELVRWLKGRGAGFYGLDVYSLYESLDLVKFYAKKLNPKLQNRILEAYSCFEFFDRDEIAYAKSLVKWPKGCEKEIVENLREILRLRLEITKLYEHELFDIQQNARIIRSAEKYYRAMINGGAEAWNIRDKHMMDTLDSLLRYYGEGAKAIVWAHNTHIGDYHATNMVEEGYVNLGGLARERYGIDNVSLVGFGTYEGEVLAGKAWGAPAQIMKLPEAMKQSYEYCFHKASQAIGKNAFYMMLENSESLSLTKGHRAVGVVYQPIFESHAKNYVPTKLSKRYDAFIHVDKTTALKALPSDHQKGMFPETYPVGV